MEIRQNQRILRKLRKYIRSSESGNYEIGLFGTGEESQNIFHYLKRHDIDISFFLSKKEEKMKTINGVRIYSFREYEKLPEGTTYIVSPEKIHLPARNMKLIYNRQNPLLSRLKRIFSFFHSYQEAYTYYKELLKKYGRHTFFYVFQGKSGDLYNAGVYLKSYVAPEEDYKLFVIGQACMKTATFLGFTNAEPITLYHADLLNKLFLLFGGEINIKLLHCSKQYIPSSIFTRMQIHKGLTLGHMYKYYALHMPEYVKPSIPDYKLNEACLKLLKEKGFEPGNTVILSPYANSYMDDGLWGFWERLAGNLSHSGYKVYTNSAGISEPAIKNTELVFFDLQDACGILDKAGTFIALRSGLCDIVSSSKAKKIILYNRDIWKETNFFEFHSLKALELSDNCIEIEYSKKDNGWTEQLIDAVLQKI